MRNSLASFQPYSVKATKDEHLRYLPKDQVDDPQELQERLEKQDA